MGFVFPLHRKPSQPPVSKKNEFIDPTIRPEIETKPPLKGGGYSEVRIKPETPGVKGIAPIPLAISKKITDEKLKKFINLRL